MKDNSKNDILMSLIDKLVAGARDDDMKSMMRDDKGEKDECETCGMTDCDGIHDDGEMEDAEDNLAKSKSKW